MNDRYDSDLLKEKEEKLLSATLLVLNKFEN